MCGIIGQFGDTIDRRVFEQARDAMQHRGPNDAGAFYDRDVPFALGNRRLSIIDLSAAGHMPMASFDGRYVISFNGEIFNYVELRRELESVYPFRTKTDTEVLLAGFIKWRSGVLPKLIGQFAFAIWDTQEKKLFLARDHFGIKPLFYTKEGSRFLFASEIKALLKLGAAPEANEGVIFDYLAYELYEHTEKTFFQNIFSLPPAHYGVFDKNGFRVTPYWHCAEAVKKEILPRSEDEALEKFGGLLKDAIRLQLRSDVPVGITLSSGLDSSTLLHFTKEFLETRVHAFSSCLPSGDPHDECGAIDEWLKNDESAIRHASVMTPEKVPGLAEELLAIQDQPYGGMQTLHYYNLYRAQKDMPVTVLLEGQGMDEIVAGYPYFLPEQRGAYIRSFTNPEIKPGYLNHDFLAKQKEAAARRREIVLPFRDDLRNAQWIDIRYRKLPKPLRFNDHISMAFSKELRVPFLDWRLATFCIALPEEYKMRGGDQKYLLRAFVKERMPHAARPKKEFGAFQTEWFRNSSDLREWAMDTLRSTAFRGRPYWDYPKTLEKVEQFFHGEGNHSFFLWQMLDLEFWLRKHIDGRRITS